MAETGVGSRIDQKLSRLLSSVVLSTHSTVSTAAAGETSLVGNGYKTYKSVLASLKLPAQITASQKPRVLPGVCARTGPRSNARFGANTSGGDYTTHSVREYMKPSTKIMPVDVEHLHTWWVSHLVSLVDFILCHACHM